MTTRSRSTTVVFENEFTLKAIGRALPPGEYEVTIDEEQIEYLSFPAYRRVSTVILVPTKPGSPSVEMYQVDPLALNAAQERDARTFGAEHIAQPPLVEPHSRPTTAARSTPEAAGLLAARYAKSGLVMLSSAVGAAKKVLAGAPTNRR
jgi:hypothetical protein